ncbi:MAG: hypothetical protein QF579_04085, partial [Dehalococcoidia bacterium]|nr:hypothetical protein [Dehalococcoidia bacterium]
AGRSSSRSRVRARCRRAIVCWIHDRWIHATPRASRAELRPSGRDELFPYLYDNMDKFGFMGAVGQVEMLVLGEAGFLAGDETVVVLVEEHIMVPFPYRY